MEKKYKNSLCLMKAYPPTLGHLYLINTAIENSENVYVMVCHNKTQYISGEIRHKAIQEIFKNNENVTVLSCQDDGLPQHEDECKNLDEFYSYWVPFVYKYVEKLDAVFTSENYGDDFARYLGIEHFLVDKSRNKYKISATEVRSNPIKNWDFIIDPIKYYFVKRIVIMGPESVGKSTLTEKLAKYYRTNFVEEYGRTVFEENGNSISIDDFIKISEGRQKIEDALIKNSNKFIFCDTEDITTYLFSKLFYPDDYKKIENYFLDKIKSDKKYHLYILLKPDCEGIQDGTRCFLEEREQHYQMIKSELIKNNCDFVEIGGDWDNRYEESIKTINKKFIYNIKLIIIMELLIKMLNFYKKRYTGKELETKFNDACDELIDSGDISRKDYMQFCIDNDIEPKVKKKKESSSRSSSNDWSCGGGGGMSRGC